MEDLFWKIEELCDITSKCVRDMRTTGIQHAENDAEYRKELRKAILQERAKGTPVTIISDLCRGLPYIADLRLNRDTAEAVYKSIVEEIQANKLRIRVLNAQLQREWGEAAGGDLS